MAWSRLQRRWPAATAVVGSNGGGRQQRLLARADPGAPGPVAPGVRGKHDRENARLRLGSAYRLRRMAASEATNGQSQLLPASAPVTEPAG